MAAQGSRRLNAPVTPTALTQRRRRTIIVGRVRLMRLRYGISQLKASSLLVRVGVESGTVRIVGVL
jgi:hypothetical protein